MLSRQLPLDGYELGYETALLSRLLNWGREWDREVHLLYLRNRWYDPGTGRFVSEDPLGLSGGLNPYVYAGNDPVNHTDPYGLDCVGIAICITGVVAKVIAEERKGGLARNPSSRGSNAPRGIGNGPGVSGGCPECEADRQNLEFLQRFAHTCPGSLLIAGATIGLDFGSRGAARPLLRAGAHGLEWLYHSGRAALRGGRGIRPGAIESILARSDATRYGSQAAEYFAEGVPYTAPLVGAPQLLDGRFSAWEWFPISGSMTSVRSVGQNCEYLFR